MGVSANGPAPSGLSYPPLPDGAAMLASRSTVGYSNNWRGVISHPACAARLTICSVRIESPPSTKKLSCRPTRVTPRTADQTSARARSAAVVGAAYTS